MKYRIILTLLFLGFLELFVPNTCFAEDDSDRTVSLSKCYKAVYDNYERVKMFKHFIESARKVHLSKVELISRKVLSIEDDIRLLSPNSKAYKKNTLLLKKLDKDLESMISIFISRIQNYVDEIVRDCGEMIMNYIDSYLDLHNINKSKIDQNVINKIIEELNTKYMNEIDKGVI